MLRFNLLAAVALSSVGYAVRPALAQEATQSALPNEIAADDIIVTGRRGERDISTIASSISVIGSEAIQAQGAINANVGSFLEFNVPGMAPQDSSFQTPAVLRGRTALVLVDGVPQNQLLRGSGYDTNVIAPEVLGRVEVLRGASALYGFGSSGGIINFITKDPSRDGVSVDLRLRTSFQTSKVEPTKEIYGQIEAGNENVGAILAVGYDERGDRYDSRGNFLSNFNNEFGDRKINIFGKVVWNVAPDHELSFTGNYLSQEANDIENYAILTTVTNPRTRVPTLAGRVPVFFLDYDAQFLNQPQNIPTDLGVSFDTGDKFQFTNAVLTYRGKDILGSQIELQGLFNRTDIFFPYSRFAGVVSAQSRRSERQGFRATINTPLDVFLPGTNLAWGVDYLHYTFDEGFLVPERGILRRDRFAARLTPYTVQKSLGFFGQFDWTVGALTLTGGVRREDYDVDLEDANLSDVDPTVFFEGGKLSYGGTTFNAGAVYNFSEGWTGFLSFSQGLDVTPISGAAFLVSDASLIDPQVSKTNSYEAGVRFRRSGVTADLAIFLAESELANRTLSLPGFRVEPLRLPEKIWGIEGTIKAQITNRLLAGGTFTYQEGTQDQEDGSRAPVPNSFISPPSIAAYAQYELRPSLTARLQGFYTFKTDRFADDLDDFDAFNKGDYESRLTVDALVAWDAGRAGRFSIGVDNIFNTFYFSPYTLAFSGFFDFEPATGRTITLTYNKRF